MMQQTISSTIKKYWYMFLPAQLLFYSFKHINNIFVQVALYSITVILMFTFLKRKYPEIFQDKQRPSIKIVIEIVMLMWLSRMMTGVISFVLSKFLPIRPDAIYGGLSRWEQFYLIILNAPVVEEVYNRGIALHAMLPFGVTNAFIMNSIIFALPHSGLSNMIYAFVVCFLFSYASYKYGIWWSIFFHALANSFSLFLSYLIAIDRTIFNLGSQTIKITQLLVFAFFLTTILCLIYFGRKINQNRSFIKEFWAEYKPNRGQLAEIFKNKWMISFIAIHAIGIILLMFISSGLIS